MWPSTKEMVSSGTITRQAGLRLAVRRTISSGVRFRQVPAYTTFPSERWGASAACSWLRLQKQG